MAMKRNPYGRAEILTPDQISLLFTEGFTKPREPALFGVCLYGATRIKIGTSSFMEQKKMCRMWIKNGQRSLHLGLL